MKNLFRLATVFTVLGWLSFCVTTGLAVAVSAGTVAGVIACLLVLFFTYFGLFLYQNTKNEAFGCLVIGAFAVWLVISAWSVSVCLGTLMATGWAIVFGVLIVIAWIVITYVRMVTKGK